MKLSRWNSYITLGSESGLIYNAYTDKYIIIKTGFDRIINVIREHSRDISLLPGDLITKFIEGGMLVDNDIDEVRMLADLIAKCDNDDSAFQLILNPTLDCNFHCWYCYEGHVPGSKMSLETQRNVMALVNSIISANPNLQWFHLSFFGGEPLLRHDDVVMPLIRHISTICECRHINLSVQFTTNAFLISDQIIDELAPYRPSFQITLDGGKDAHNQTRFSKGGSPSFDVILDNISKLADKGLKVLLRINYTLKNLESTAEIIDRLQEFASETREYIRIDYQRVWQDAENPTDQSALNKLMNFKKRFEDIGCTVCNHTLANHVTASCYGDKTNEMVINYNGDIFACTARDFCKERRLGKLLAGGRVEWNEDLLTARRSVKLKKKVCRQCRIAPICGGGCRTKCLETLEMPGCQLGYSDEDIDNLILDRFEARFMTTRQL